ncbi:MAG: cell division protein FtsZ [Balneolaceae bacterium]|nr:cell division protein FtsZ [Balneolaceae bacterium]MCH8547735.1 cell division protein FtsZ [Balneolaceae bacterium]
MDNMNSRFSFDEKGQDNAKIKVIGVGGGGGNAVNNMIRRGLDSVEYIALNTDAQALKNSAADLTVQVGSNLTSGLGAGARPEIGREAVEENRHDLDEAVDSADMIFITAGMGGGTGTGGAPVVAGIAKRKGILTVGIVTTPFQVEGKVRMKYAMEGIAELKKNCDTVIVIPNERLLDIADENTSLIEAFEQANDVLYNATRGISDLILMPGLINLDFADVRTTMIDGGAAIMGSATASGDDRAEIAAREAINSPLLDGVSIRGARNVLVNISAGSQLGMRETTTATRIIQQEAGDDAEIILGTVLDESFGDELRVTVIATGFELANDKSQTRIEPSKKGRTDSGDKRRSLLPKAEDIVRRRSHTDGDFYKGEKNLKNLDSPAIGRRNLKYISTNVEQEADEEYTEEIRHQRRKASNDDTLLNDRSERIDKRDTDQPAFLRKIMD